MARVVVVHGINNTFTTASSMAALWTPALLGGLELAGLGDLLTADDVACVAWGDLFRTPGRFLGDEGDEDEADIKDLFEQELLMAWWTEAAARDPYVMPPDATTLGIRSTVRTALNAIAGAKFLARTTEGMIAFWLRQFRGYLLDPAIRADMQKRFVAQINADTKVVVAHSLGSVIAYEALCSHPEWQVTDFVSLGSPLGVRHIVYDRLRPEPGRWPGVQRWVNISDAADFVALEPRLRKMFGDGVVDVEIDNGVAAHSVERYLTAAETGSAVAAAF
ncbi:hypothetical protein OWR29_26375 [Actinoplanes sp. Pm04-4]|uniref:Alpha/beta hydrolase n=1 Tax=Paractinoplanes pyxinae TaxID=2997416 RepID=A0ABT4B4X7_9ACTN|nr:hypothetical protein [Actinoplanes pyxinae]MCY1141539.1 hypothetical protein [Actinoplanes pyxinae]